MATAASNPAAIPAELHQPLEQLADALQRAVDGALVPTELQRLAANAAPLVGMLTSAGCEAQARFLADCIRHLETATSTWAQICANPSTSTTGEFDDTVYQAFDCACWALQWEDPALHRELPAGVEVIDLQAAA